MYIIIILCTLGDGSLYLCMDALQNGDCMDDEV